MRVWVLTCTAFSYIFMCVYRQEGGEGGGGEEGDGRAGDGGDRRASQAVSSLADAHLVSGEGVAQDSSGVHVHSDPGGLARNLPPPVRLRHGLPQCLHHHIPGTHRVCAHGIRMHNI